MGDPLKDLGIKLYCVAVGANGVLELFLAEVSRSQIAKVRSSLIVQIDRVRVLLDRLAVFFGYVIDHAQIVVGVSILAVVFDGALEVFLGIFVMLQQQFGNPELVEEDGIVGFLL